jgi:hypothetical protein
MKVITDPNVKTDRLGGVDVPVAEVLKQMHQGQYITPYARGEAHTSTGGEEPAPPRSKN